MTEKDKTYHGASGEKQPGIDSKRRSLARLGLTTPVLMTLASRPALAKQCSTSAWNSGNMSDPVDMQTCGPCTNDQWFNAKSSNWKNAGMSEEDLFELFFTVPEVTYKDKIIKQKVTEKAVSGDLASVLDRRITISSGTKYHSQNAEFDKSTGDQYLTELCAYAVAVYLNTCLVVTSTNYTDAVQTRTDVISAIELALELNNKRKMDVDRIIQTKLDCEILMSDGSSCALS